ncbi:(Na+)-NQR maturation NqrM [Arenicella xantha]|uniref:(Na+)-NQR maturation NqrM n=1 Tax=Arenicella xantha TaxID=644221 RepID=A0A395JG58_9GAMM|nr:(Na+)-NQR maturation NqrM [Arenicella xantha]RBP48337.1 hypothetical protein DFR28_10866 [Arenicella xantha]
MNMFLVSFLVFVLVMIGMAIGVIVSNREIKGSCGGLNDIDGLKGACDICEGKKVCRRRRQMERKALMENA